MLKFVKHLKFANFAKCIIMNFVHNYTLLSIFIIIIIKILKFIKIFMFKKKKMFIIVKKSFVKFYI